MKENYERLRDILIGKTVLGLLSEKLPVSWHAVLEKLEATLNSGLDSEKTHAAMLAIKEVKEEMRRREPGYAGHLVNIPAANDSDDTTQH